jgi:hypothetical protein
VCGYIQNVYPVTGDSFKKKDSVEKLNNAISSGHEIWVLHNNPPLFSHLQRNGYTAEPFRKVYQVT